MKRYHANPVIFDGRGTDYREERGSIVNVADHLACSKPTCPEQHVYVIDEEDMWRRDDWLISAVIRRITGDDPGELAPTEVQEFVDMIPEALR